MWKNGVLSNMIECPIVLQIFYLLSGRLRQRLPFMQNLKEEPFKFHPNPRQIIEMIRVLWRYRKHPEVLDTYLETLKAETGAPETNMNNVRNALLILREEYLDTNAEYSLDQRLIVGTSALDLVLLAVLVPLGVPDRALFLAFLALVISLVFVAMSLIVSKMKHDLGIRSYGKVHGNVTFLGLVTGSSSLAATLWHVSSTIGLIFLALTVIGYSACLAYFMLVRTAVQFIKQLQGETDSGHSDIETMEQP